MTASFVDELFQIANTRFGDGYLFSGYRTDLPAFTRGGDFVDGVVDAVNPTAAYNGDATLLSGGETVEAAGISFQVRHVPGHSPGHLSYYAEGALFSGDVLFSGSVGRVDLPFGDWDTLLESIRSLADAYPPETTVYNQPGLAAVTVSRMPSAHAEK